MTVNKKSILFFIPYCFNLFDIIFTHTIPGKKQL